MATKAAAKPDLHIVQPDLAEMERVIRESAEVQLPATRRSLLVRDRMQMEQRSLVAERETYLDRRTLLTNQFESAKAALDRQIEDIDDTIALHEHGLLGLVGGLRMPQPDPDPSA